MLLGLLLAATASADDEIKLKNGDRVTGKVLGLGKGKLAFQTPHSGAMQVDWAQVLSLKTDGKVAVKLSTGEVIEGRLSPGQEGRLRIESEGAVAPVEVEMSKIAWFNEPPIQWHGNLGASFKSTDGNTHTKSWLVTADLVRASDSDEFLIRGIYRTSERSGDLQERNAYGLAKYSLKFTDRAYVFGSVELLSDRFKDLKLQTVVAAGFGYDLLKESWIDFGVEAGIAYVDNNFRTLQVDESHTGARAAARLRMDLPLGFVFKDLFTIYPNLEESQDFQIRNEATLTNALGKGFSLLGGVITEYDREPPFGFRRHDNTYFAGLGYGF
jgi:putative salt-induced outer membrane protein YdiY